MFADDTVLLSETKDGLQDLLKDLENYCKQWNLTVNIDKTSHDIQKGWPIQSGLFIYLRWRANRNSPKF